MKAEKLLNEALENWPSEIDISDGEVFPELNGFKSNNLSLAWDEAEEKTNDNEWLEIATWVIYSLLHEAAKLNFNNKTYTLYTKQIKGEDFKNRLRDNLSNEGYEDMLLDFNRENI